MTQSIIIAGDASAGLATSGGNDGTLVLQSGPAGGKINAVAIDATGKVALTGQAVSASTTNTITNKIKINVNGVDYYLLASTSGA